MKLHAFPLALLLLLALCAFPPSALGQRIKGGRGSAEPKVQRRLQNDKEDDKETDGETDTEADLSIVDIAAGSEDFSTLVFALNASDLLEPLSAGGPFTVYAPTNDAFAEAGVDFLFEPEWYKHLQAVLLFHVGSGDFPSEELEAGETIPTLLTGDSLNVTSVDPYAVEEVEVLDEVVATNGIVNIIGGLLFPPFVDIDIVTFAAGIPGQFSTLVSLLELTNLTSVLREDTFTVFAPTNDAFAAIPADTLNQLTSEPGFATLIDILTYHVVPGVAYADGVEEGDFVTAVNSANITVTALDPLTLNGEAEVTLPDVLASNGVVHVIDAVLMPPPMNEEEVTMQDQMTEPLDETPEPTMGDTDTPAPTEEDTPVMVDEEMDEATPGPTADEDNTIVDLAVADPALAELVALVEAAGLVETLSGEGPFTLFAPLNNAVRALEDDLVATLTSEEGLPELINILSYHVVAGIITSDDLEDGQSLEALQGDSLAVTVASDGSAMINRANIRAGDFVASNGIIHIIDEVLIPPPEGSDVTSTMPPEDDEEEEEEASSTTAPGDESNVTPTEDVTPMEDETPMTTSNMTAPPSEEAATGDTSNGGEDGVPPEEEASTDADATETGTTDTGVDAATTSSATRINVYFSSVMGSIALCMSMFIPLVAI